MNTPACAVCGTALVWVQQSTPFGQQEGWTHGGTDHIVVPSLEVTPVPRCDLCGDPDPVAQHETTPFNVLIRVGDSDVLHRHDTPWFACATCDTLIVAGDRDALAVRGSLAMAAATGVKDPEQWRSVVDAVHGAFLTHRTVRSPL